MMKKIILSAFLLLGLTTAAQEDKTWRFGIQWGAQDNHAKFAGGMETAHARFHKNKSGNGGFGIVARYDHNHRWMWLSGINFNSYGFNFAIAENYSLLGKERPFSGVNTSFGTIEIPAMVHYKFNPNCNNARWVIGAGFVETFIGTQVMNKNLSQIADGGSTVNYLSSNANVKGGNYWMLRWAISREKMYKRGGILNAALVCNLGFREIARTTVNYTIDNQNFNHEFTNNGSFIGFRLSYFFRPVHSWKYAAKKQAAGTGTITK